MNARRLFDAAASGNAACLTPQKQILGPGLNETANFVLPIPLKLTQDPTLTLGGGSIASMALRQWPFARRKRADATCCEPTP